MNRSLVVVVAACSSHPSGTHGTIIDGGQLDAAADAGARDAPSGPTVELISYGSVPTYAAYSAGGGPWHLASSTDGRTYEIAAGADYRFVAVCASSDGAIDEVEVDAMGSAGANAFSCFSDDGLGSAPPTVAATGTMDQAGTITLFEIATGSASPWSFSIQVAANTTQDLFAIGSAAMLIRRDLAFATAPQAIATIDLASDGAALVAQPIAITGLGSDDGVTTQVGLSTQNGYATISNGSTATSLVLPPPSLLANTDEQLIAIDAFSATRDRQVQTTDPAITTFALLPALDGIAFAGGSASWAALPDAERYEFRLAAVAQTATVSMSPAWIAATAATTVGFDDAAPGWQPAWSFWKNVAAQASFTAASSDATSYYSTAALGSAN